MKRMKKIKWELHKNVTCLFEQILKAIPHKKQLYGHLPPSYKPST